MSIKYDETLNNAGRDALVEILRESLAALIRESGAGSTNFEFVGDYLAPRIIDGRIPNLKITGVPYLESKKENK